MTPQVLETMKKIMETDTSVAIVGAPGTGKTHLARQFRPNAEVLSQVTSALEFFQFFMVKTNDVIVDMDELRLRVRQNEWHQVVNILKTIAMQQEVSWVSKVFEARFTYHGRLTIVGRPENVELGLKDRCFYFSTDNQG